MDIEAEIADLRSQLANVRATIGEHMLNTSPTTTVADEMSAFMATAMDAWRSNEANITSLRECIESVTGILSRQQDQIIRQDAEIVALRKVLEHWAGLFGGQALCMAKALAGQPVINQEEVQENGNTPE